VTCLRKEAGGVYRARYPFFAEPGLQLLTFHYGKGNNFADLEFEPLEAAPTEKR
jgi:hypothetical protein